MSNWSHFIPNHHIDSIYLPTPNITIINYEQKKSSDREANQPTSQPTNQDNIFVNLVVLGHMACYQKNSPKNVITCFAIFLFNFSRSIAVSALWMYNSKKKVQLATRTQLCQPDGNALPLFT